MISLYQGSKSQLADEKLKTSSTTAEGTII